MSQRQDDMNKLFREHLNDASSGSAGWDHPSDAVWDGIEARLKARKRRRGGWYWLLGIPLLVFSGYHLLSSDQTPGINLQPDPVQLAAPSSPADITGKSADRGAFEESGIALSKIDTVDQSASADPGETNQGPDKTTVAGARADGPTISEKRPDKAPEAEAGQDPSSPARAAQKQLPEASGRAGVEQTEHASTTDRTSSTTPARTEPLSESTTTSDLRQPLLMIPLESNQSRMYFSREIPAMEPPEALRSQSTSHWTLSAYAGPSWGSRHMTVANNRPRLAKVLLRQQEEPVLQASLGTSIAYQASRRWDIGIGMEYAAFLLRSDYQHQVRYSRSGEVDNGQGAFESNYRVEINTSYGRVETDIVVERESDAAIPEHTFINLDFLMEQSFRYVRIPVFARYHFQAGKLRMFGSGGLALQHLSSSTLDFKAIQSMSDKVRRVKQLHSGTLRGTNRTTLGFQVGLGVEIPGSEQLSFIINPTLNGSLDPVYSRELIKIFPYTIDLRLGVTYRFR